MARRELQEACWDQRLESERESLDEAVSCVSCPFGSGMWDGMDPAVSERGEVAAARLVEDVVAMKERNDIGHLEADGWSVCASEESSFGIEDFEVDFNFDKDFDSDFEIL